MIWFHGATRLRLVWDHSSCGKGADQYGPGWYFTSSFEEAVSYAAPRADTPCVSYPSGGYVHVCRLLLDEDDVYGNLVSDRDVDEWRELYAVRFRRMIQESPAVEDNLANWSENKFQALRAASYALSRCRGPFDAAQQVWRDHYFHFVREWASKLSVIFGWDGGLPPAAADGTQRVVVWNPQVIVVDDKIPYAQAANRLRRV